MTKIIQRNKKEFFFKYKKNPKTKTLKLFLNKVKK